MLSIYGLRNMVEFARALTSSPVRHVGLSIVFLVISLFVALNAHYVMSQYRYVVPFDYLLGKLSRDAYIAKYRPEYAAVQYINSHLPPNALILFIFSGNRGYYCERKYLAGESLINEVFLQSKSAEEILLGLRKEGVTHLLIYHHLLEKWIRDNDSNGTEDIVKGFFEKYVRILFFEKGFSVSILGDSF